MLTICVGYYCARVIQQAQQRAQTFRLVAENGSDGLVLMEANSRILWVNDAYCKIMGYQRDELIGKFPARFAVPAEDKMSDADIEAFRFDPDEERFGSLTQAVNIRKSGERFVYEFSHAVVYCGKQQRFLVSGRDVTDRVEREKALEAAYERLEALSLEDVLTGLGNRAALREKLERLIAGGTPFAMIQMDLNLSLIHI